MTSSSPFEITKNTPFLKEAVNPHQYKSFDGINLSVGQTVYQIGQLEGSYTPILREFIITALDKNGRIVIKGDITINNIKHSNTFTINPNNVHTNIKELIEYYLANIKHKMKVELVEYYNGLVKIMLEYDPKYPIDLLEVGEGIKNEMEI